MKKRVLSYLTVILSVFSLQSCVSNYVVSQPTNYKTDAKLASITPNKLSEAKKEISPAKQIDIALANIEKANKSAEIQKTILFEKKMDDMLAEAESYLGTPYRYGGTTRSGIDCSAFVLSVFGATMGMHLPRVAAAQAQEGERVAREDMRKGDLVFFSNGGRISHVGIVHDVDENGSVKFIHASTSRGVMISPLTDSYWGPKFRFAKRIVNDDIIDYSSLAQN
ncbi:Probable endopeptidase Spr precursor [Chryseobacterium taklimakanense]|uniref:Probable endopeptidase Spr n=1 Tax=Chryseobacterium taklimakanense TaxID=536441 RepID=A0A239XMQ1_9FLAO|nr:C40 family peptidase [Chryseobacterium taklimakanense]SNV47660.1 Probable endopeptidase Spr precursor [Chryseobacterium taklimakanense]